MRRSKPIASLAFAALVLAAISLACGSSDFDPASKITSVRVLATRADKPFAKPGDDVTIEALTVDGRADRSTPMHVYWLPISCVNPRNDLYYACFAALAGKGGADAGAPSDAGPGPDGGGPTLPSAVTAPLDITPYLQEGPTTTVHLPADIIASHPKIDGAPAPYGLAIRFFVACAGRVFLLPPDPSNASGQVMPIGCGSDPDHLAGSDDWVFAFTRVYAYDTLSNENPVIESVSVDGKPVDVTQGVVVPKCTSSEPADCEHAIDVRVPDASWEVNASDLDADGVVRHEQLYASYFYQVGSTKTKSTGRILFDPLRGRIEDSANRLIAGSVEESGRVWIVVHDNRLGVAWTSFPVFVK